MIVARNVFRWHSELLLLSKLLVKLLDILWLGSEVFVAPQTRVTAGQGKLSETTDEVTEALSTLKLIMRELYLMSCLKKYSLYISSR